jgi:SAM-dependent methyltransferase
MWTRVLGDNLKACVPFKPILRRVLRRASPYRSLPENDDWAIEQGIQLICRMREHNVGMGSVLEVGTGWLPTIPKLLKACGAARILLTDVERLCDEPTGSHAAFLAERAIPRLADATGIDEKTLRTGLARDGVEEYRCPPRLREIEQHSIDLIYSRAVLEHMPVSILKEQLEEWKRLLTPGGFCIHLIDNSDHFEHRDKTLSRLNFLTLTDRAWKFASFNPQNYQNRLRHSDYVSLFGEAGYDLVHVEGALDARALADLHHLKVAEIFRRYNGNDLAILTTLIVAKPRQRDDSFVTCGEHTRPRGAS